MAHVPTMPMARRDAPDTPVQGRLPVQASAQNGPCHAHATSQRPWMAQGGDRERNEWTTQKSESHQRRPFDRIASCPFRPHALRSVAMCITAGSRTIQGEIERAALLKYCTVGD